jgi:hypothetical protein
MDKEGPKHLYTIRYTIPAKLSGEMLRQQLMKEITDELTDIQMELEGFPEANELITRIKAQQ